MLLALLALALVAAVLLAPTLARAARELNERRGRASARRRSHATHTDFGDPGRERRAEQRARELLRSCVNDEEWSMYRDLGFIRVYGKLVARRPVFQDAISTTEQPEPAP